MSSLPGLGRHHPVTFSLGGYGYAATGTTTQQSATDDFYRYDPVQDLWSTLPDFPGPDRSYAYGGQLAGRGYLGFGFGGGYLADLWEFDPAGAGWSPLASLPAAGRMHPAFVVTPSGKIFVGMGWGAAGNLRDWWEYDIASNLWTRKADLPGPARHHPYYFSIGNVPYVGLGHGAGAYRDLYRFDPDSNTWTRLGDFPGEARVAGTQFSHGGNGYIASGLGADDQPLDTGEFWEYEPAGDGWTPLTPHPGSGRWAPGTFLIGSTLYLLAGESAVQMERDMWRYDLTPPADLDSQAVPEAPSLSLFPNPIRGGQLRIRTTISEGDVEGFLLLGPDGRRVADLGRPSAAIELPSSLSAGKYFVTLVARDGGIQSGGLVVLR